MPHTLAAAKYLRKTEKRRLRNRSVKKAIKVQIKKFMDVAKTGNIEDLQKELIATTKKLDKAAAKRVVHPNMAARKKGQLAKLVHAKQSTPPAAPKA
ncbi:30S ribosomal protein S20 [soil metagenome]